MAQTTTELEWAATFFGLYGKWLMGSKRRFAWWCAIATHAIFIAICYERAMWGIMPLNFFGLALSIRGLLLWRSHD